MIGYKLLNADMTSYGGCTWVVGETKRTSGEGPLCTDGWLHFYEDPLLAVLHDPVHGEYLDRDGARLFQCLVGDTIRRDGQMKAGAMELTLVEELPLPRVTLTQWAAYALLCVQHVSHEEAWRDWAGRWLSGEDRSIGAAQLAIEAAQWMAAKEAAMAARERAWLITDWEAVGEARVIMWAAWAVENTAAACQLDLLSIARQAIEHY